MRTNVRHPLKLGNQVLKNELPQTLYQGVDPVQPFDEIIPGGLPVIEGKDNIADLLVELTHNITGFEKQSISLDSRLLDDLNLDSIKAAELIGQAARTLGIAGQLDPSKLSNNTLGEIRNRLFELTQIKSDVMLQGRGDNVFSRYQDKTWVRNFIPVFKNEEIKTRNVNQLKSLKNIVILRDTSESEFADSIANEFPDLKIQKINYGEKLKAVKDGSIDCVIAVLPKGDRGIRFDLGVMKEVYTRAHQLVDLAASDKLNREAFIVLVGFGGGNFGENENLKNLSSSGMKALLSTLFLEYPNLKVRVLDFDTSSPDAKISFKIIEELQTYDRFGVVGYDAQLKRNVIYYENSQQASYGKRAITWSKNDVVLVTGGAKGITAECALEFARSTKAQMVLVGRTPKPMKSDENNEISQTLKKFESEGLKAKYISCDITNQKEVNILIGEIERNVGKITGFVHGAGLNSLKRLKQSSLDEAIKESLPKIIGAVNVCCALSDGLKLIVGITSIIGVTGMEGSGWYGLSNELLNLYLHQYKSQHPKTEVVTIAYSIWDEVGMGTKLGSINKLAEKGIGAIPVKEGINHFKQLVESNPGVQQVIVSARLAGLDTWKLPPLKPSVFRFIEKVEYFMPGVELIAKAQLNVKDDPYLLDHNWKGSLLFPFVFGLEAMAQAVAYVLGVDGFDNIKVKDINLKRPINVPEESGTNIEIHSEIIEQKQKSKFKEIKVEIYSQESAYLEPHFSAIFEINLESGSQKKIELIKTPKETINLDVKTDIYGPILFQGRMFQYIEKIHKFNYNDKTNKGECVFSSVYKKNTVEFLRNNKKFNSQFLIGDPFLIDSTLQSMQLIITPHMSLPNYIGELMLFNLKESKSAQVLTESYVSKIDDKLFNGTTNAQGENGFGINIKNCNFIEIEYLKDKPSANDFTDSTVRDLEIIQSELLRLRNDFNIISPAFSLLSNKKLMNGNLSSRHEIEIPLIRDTIKSLLIHGNQKTKNADLKVKWLKSGKPIVKDQDFEISLSHDKDVLICVAGQGKQGCDIETIADRTEKDWLSLLGKEKFKLLKERWEEVDPNINYLGTALWSVYETIKKATGEDEVILKLVNLHKNTLIFNSPTLPFESVIILFSLKLTKGAPRVISFVGSKKQVNVTNQDSEIVIGGFTFDKSKYKLEVQHDVSQNQIVFTKRFPVTFKHTQNMSRSVYFANYFDWMGDIREYCLSPIIKNIKELLEKGQLGMATNSAKVRILGELRADDVVEARFWLQKISGKEDAVYDFNFDWFRIRPDGSNERVALSEQRISWIKITGHGEGVLVRPPQIFQDFMSTLKPKENIRNIPVEFTESFKNLTLGPEMPFNKGINNKSLLKESVIETTLADSNLVGNIYFSNYSKWLGRVRDTFFYNILSDYYKGFGEMGEFKCLSCDINHLGEAMPFDKVIIKMYLDKVYENGMDLNFEFYKEQKNQSFQKLAFARHKIVWCKMHKNGVAPEKMPAQLMKAIHYVTK